MEPFDEIGKTLEYLRQNEEALLSLNMHMQLEKEALERTQDSLLAHLEFLKGEYQKIERSFSRIKYSSEKHSIYQKVLEFNQIAHRPLMGYLPLFKESNISIRKRRKSKILVS